MPYNAASRKDVRRAEKDAKTGEIQEAEVLVNLMSDIPGRQFVWSQLERSGVFNAGASTDVGMTYFLAGQRNEGIILLNKILEHCPHLFLEMIQERNAKALAKENTDVQRGPDESEPDARSEDD